MAISARIEELERKFNENPRRYFAPLANEYRKAGDLTQAISICRTYVPQQPAHMSGHIVFGQALFEAGEFEEARTIFESALQLDPENLIALRHLGDIARERGEITAARTWYRRVLDADPRNEEISGLLRSLDGVPDRQLTTATPAVSAPAVPSNADIIGNWQDVNPERTLELPPALAQAARLVVESAAPPAPLAPPAEAAPVEAPVAAATVAPEPPTAEPEPALPPTYAEPESVGASGGLMEGFYSAEHDTEALHAAEQHAAESTGPSSDLGLESMEFVPPPRAERTSPADQSLVDAQSDTPSAFVTETMAELYLQQGFREEALTVYRQLLSQNPDDVNLRERVEQLASGSRSSVGAAALSDDIIDAAHQRRNAPSVKSVRSFFGGLAARRIGHGSHQEPVSEPMVAEAEMPVAEMQAHEPQVAEPEPTEPEPAEPEPTEPQALEMAAPDAPTEALTQPTEALTQEMDAIEEPAKPQTDASPARDVFANEEGPSGATSLLGGAFTTSDSYSDDAFSENAFGSNAFTGGFSTGASGAFIGADDFSSEGLVSRQAEEVDVFGLPLRTEQSPLDEPTTVAAEPAAEVPHAAADQSHGQAHDQTPDQTHDQTGSVDGLFASTTVTPDDEAAASTLSGAYGGPSSAASAEVTPAAAAATPVELPPSSAPATDHTVRGASSELSLDSVFRESTSPASDSRRESSAFSFDQFFGGDSTANAEPPVSPSQHDEAADANGQETEQFSSWLSGLKKK